MEKHQRDCLRSNSVTLTNDIDLEPVILYLKSKLIFDNHHEDDIKSETTKIGKASKLISLIQTRGPNAFRELYNALSGQPHLADLLRPHLETTQPNSGSSERQPEPERSVQWQAIASELGLSEFDPEAIAEDLYLSGVLGLEEKENLGEKDTRKKRTIYLFVDVMPWKSGETVAKLLKVLREKKPRAADIVAKYA